MIGLQPDAAGPVPAVESKPSTPTRAEWLETAKRRAMDLVRAGGLHMAFVQFTMEIHRHPDLRKEFATLGRVLDGFKAMHNGELATKEKMSTWIHSFT